MGQLKLGCLVTPLRLRKVEKREQRLKEFASKRKKEIQFYTYCGV